jgi:hypothetical protein
MRRCTVILLFTLFIISCKQQSNKTLFVKLSSEETGIDFTNNITETKENNVYTYQYYYNGNGVAVGDLNGDGLTDVFITGNQTPSKLFLNQGDFHFKDITATAGVAGKNAWRTGANVVDINGDGLLDIYVCYSGFGTDEDRAKQLFINIGNNKDGIPVFTEKAAEYGIDAVGTYTSQAAFLDYDQDGDLDMFLLNHANEFYSPFYNTKRLRTLRHPQYGNRLYRNDGQRFADVSDSAGIFGGGNNFGLGIAVSDINSDGWSDILVSNDFHEQDYFYVNNQDGTFKEVCQQVFGHMSRNTMGLDIADINNDLQPDVVTLDMLPESNYRQKILQGPDEYDKYNTMVDSGYGHQQNRNMLQLNRGFGPDGLPVFSEIGQLSGVSNTDWSWAALLADLDNDGFKDLFITNGYLKESTNLDFMKYEVAEALEQAKAQGKDVYTPQGYNNNMPLFDLVQKMPATRISNYAYRNKGDLTFADETKNWGLDERGVSSGATYADFDNDGDLDLIVCNNDDPVWVYKNQAEEINHNNFIKVKLQGDQKNLFGIGAKVRLITDSGWQMLEMNPARGYQSTVDYTLHFGLGKSKNVKSIEVFWSNDTFTLIENPAMNATVVAKKSDATAIKGDELRMSLFQDVTPSSGINFIRKENEFIDFKREFLIPYELSKQGPKMAKGDVNNDGLEDVFIGAPAGQSGALYLQMANSQFKLATTQPWMIDSISEDISSIFFDADNDNDLDLYVVSGGNEWLGTGPELQDRLYINDGKGNFGKAEGILPTEAFSGSCVTACDFDKDGDLDLFVGSRCVPGYYPLSGGSMLLRNDYQPSVGYPRFTNITELAGGEGLFKAGMVIDAVWTDVDKDGWQDLVVTGDWMPVCVFHNENGKKLTNITESLGLGKSNGWWCRIIPADVDHDGDIDFIAGNLGTNTQFKVNNEEPLITYVDDFDGNGRLDPLMTWYIQHASYPFNSRDELVGQLPVMNKKFLRYADYGKATINEILTKDQIEKARKLYIYETRTSLFINNNGKFEQRALPVETQFSVVNSILYRDFDSDGKEDILLAGNFYPFRAQEGPCDASFGTVLKGDGKGGFTSLRGNEARGLYIPGDLRDMIELHSNSGDLVIVSKNSDKVQVLKPIKH